VSLKDELQHVKEELSSDEKILESAFKLEKLYKKYKYLIWGVLVLLVVGYAGNAGWNAYRQSKLDAANEAFLTLRQNPLDKNAASKLKANNPRLYELFELKQAIDNKASDKLKTLEASSDPVVAAIAGYHNGVLSRKPVDTPYYHDMAVIEEAYLDLKSGNKKAASDKLSLISEDSPAAKIAQLLKHYAIEAK